MQVLNAGVKVLESLSMLSHSMFARTIQSPVHMDEQHEKYRGFQQICRILFAEGMYN